MDHVAVLMFHVPVNHIAVRGEVFACPFHVRLLVAVFDDPVARVVLAEAALHIAVGGRGNPMLGVTVWHLGAGHVANLALKVSNGERAIAIVACGKGRTWHVASWQRGTAICGRGAFEDSA